ncbi:MAG: acyl carrier protein [Acidimicrobiia bacterium]|nr:acyl carrier protein [Acidimicrobiia bacterium]
MADITQDVKDFLLSELLDGATDLQPDTPLLKTELIDSMGVLTLVGFLEDEYGIIIAADDVSAANFETLVTITRLVESKLG